MYTQCKEESHAEHKAMTERFAIKIERKVEIELQRSKRSRNNLVTQVKNLQQEKSEVENTQSR
eukprot:765425-Hanusia_phi.AAC.2